MVRRRFSPLFFLVFTSLHSETIPTFYGPIEVEEPVLLELIHSPAFQRLKFIHQYGVSYYTKTHPEEYSRFDHSLGVFAILRAKGAVLEEQISGLLHDASHTVFSHVADWVFPKEQQDDDYQNHIHDQYLRDSGIGDILKRYGLRVEEISPKRIEFKMLEQPLPDLSADRIDYNIQGAYYQNFLTLEEARRIFDDLVFEEGKWIIANRDLAHKLAYFSLFMTEDCWGSATNWFTSRWLADALIRGFELSAISLQEFHFGIDQNIWDQLLTAQDPLIQEQMERLANPGGYFRLVSPLEASHFIPFKCRGIDPWIVQEGGIARLSTIDQEFESAFQRTEKKSSEGWPVQILYYTRSTSAAPTKNELKALSNRNKGNG